jgi:hypothetical protein
MKAGYCLGAVLALAAWSTSVAFAQDAAPTGGVAPGHAASGALANDSSAGPIDSLMMGGNGRATDKAHEAVTNVRERLLRNAKSAKSGDSGPLPASLANQENRRQALDRPQSPAGAGKDAARNAIGAVVGRHATLPPNAASDLVGHVGSAAMNELPARSRDIEAHGIVVAPIGAPSINGTGMTRTGSGTGTAAAVVGLTRSTVGAVNGTGIRARHP